MTNGHDRRRFLQIAGTGAAASLAGCNALGNLTQQGDGDEADDTLTVSVAPDPEDIDELVEAVEAEEIDAAEARQQQQQLVEDAVADFEARADEESELTIEESTEEMALFRVDASADVLIDALQNGEVSSIHTGAAYDRFLEQQQRRQQQQQAPPQAPENGSEGDGEGTGDGETDDGESGDETEGGEDGSDDAAESGDDAEAENSSDAQ